jgi:hypothetical protein
MAEEASAGTIQINLALNLAPLEQGVQKANKQLSSISGFLKKEFDKAGGHLGNFGEMLGSVGKNVKKMFGDEAPQAMQRFGKEVQTALGLTDKQVKGLAQSVESLEGTFKAVGVAVKAMTTPFGIALIAVLGLVAAFGGHQLRPGLRPDRHQLRPPGHPPRRVGHPPLR